MASVLLPAVTAQQRERLPLQQTVQELAIAARQEPTAGRIALEYLKQSEAPEQQARIAQLWHEVQAEGARSAGSG